MQRLSLNLHKHNLTGEQTAEKCIKKRQHRYFLVDFDCLSVITVTVNRLQQSFFTSNLEVLSFSQLCTSSRQAPFSTEKHGDNRRNIKPASNGWREMTTQRRLRFNQT